MASSAVTPPAAVAGPARYASVDNLKVALVIGVIVAHVTAAWSANEDWVLNEPPVRDPLLTILRLASLVGVLFAMPLFFLIAGSFTPPSLTRKGTRRYLADRMLRLGVPLVVYLLVLAPIVEWADPGSAGWVRGFAAFVAYIWWHPAPGPLWFLWVLLLLSVGYAAVRAVRPGRAAAPTRMLVRYLLAAGVFVSIASYAVRLWVPLGEEAFQDLFVGQAPAWVTGFALGALGGERGWFERISPAMSRWLFRVAWTAVACVIVAVSVVVGALDADVTVFFGGGTWQSLLLAGCEGALVVAMSLWLLDVFRRRVNHHRPLLRAMSRAAFAAFLVHQVVAIGAVLATRCVAWPPEVEYPVAATLAVVGSFGVGALLVRIPGVARIV